MGRRSQLRHNARDWGRSATLPQSPAGGTTMRRVGAVALATLAALSLVVLASVIGASTRSQPTRMDVRSISLASPTAAGASTAATTPAAATPAAATPRPTRLVQPSVTPQPTATPQPTSTAQPTATPQSTSASQPTATPQAAPTATSASSASEGRTNSSTGALGIVIFLLILILALVGLIVWLITRRGPSGGPGDGGAQSMPGQGVTPVQTPMRDERTGAQQSMAQERLNTPSAPTYRPPGMREWQPGPHPHQDAPPAGYLEASALLPPQGPSPPEQEAADRHSGSGNPPVSSESESSRYPFESERPGKSPGESQGVQPSEEVGPETAR